MDGEGEVRRPFVGKDRSPNEDGDRRLRQMIRRIAATMTMMIAKMIDGTTSASSDRTMRIFGDKQN
jgi:hypothetical protein